MIIVGLILSVFGIGFLCWLLFTLAVYALPFYVAMIAGLAAYHSGAGAIGAFLVGLLAGALTLVTGQVAFAVVTSPLLRGAIAFLFTVPAAVAGYHATPALAHVGVPSETWREVFATIGAIVVGCTAFIRMIHLAVPLSPGRTLATGSAQPLLPPPATASRQG